MIKCVQGKINKIKSQFKFNPIWYHKSYPMGADFPVDGSSKYNCQKYNILFTV